MFFFIIIYIFHTMKFLIVVISKYHENLAESNMNSNKSLQSQKQAKLFVLCFFLKIFFHFIFFSCFCSLCLHPSSAKGKSMKEVKKIYKVPLNSKTIWKWLCICRESEKIDNKVCGGKMEAATAWGWWCNEIQETVFYRIMQFNEWIEDFHSRVLQVNPNPFPTFIEHGK